MVTFAQLHDARPSLWQDAADDWAALAKEAERAADDIYQRGTAALDEHWADHLGAQAKQTLTDLANSFQVASALVHGAVSVLDGLAESVQTLQTELSGAVDFAARYGLVVGADGQVSQQPGWNCDEDAQKAGQANRLIQEALTSATAIDNEAHAELDRLAAAVNTTDLTTALNTVQQQASDTQLQMLDDALPIGADPATVAAWWNALTPAQQHQYELATPVELDDLDGIPADVKKSMEGTDGYNRVEMVRWAQQNVNNTSIDIFDNNCANFVSNSLEHAGMDEHLDFWKGTQSSDSWGHGAQTGWGWLDEHDYSHSDSWAQADAQRNFFLSHGSTQVPQAQAQPGDIIYFEQDGPGGPTDPGKVHHAAVVTSVTPDGTIHYTQHSDPRSNANLDGRLPANDVHEGNQKVVIVRPKQTW